MTTIDTNQPHFFQPPFRPSLFALSIALAFGSVLSLQVRAQESQPTQQLDEIVVSASRSEQNRFDAPAAIDVVPVNAFSAQSPLVNMSELLSAVPGVQVRERQNYAQDLQISVRGFGTRSTFGVRGVRILIDGIPATMPDGQGQASSASLASASRMEILRGPMAQLYGNSAGGVLQVFTKDPPLKPEGSLSLGLGSDNQRLTGVSAGGGNETLGGVIDLTQYSTDGYRDHSAARRTTINAKVVARPSSATKITAILNSFDQPLSQDPLGLNRADFQANPRQVVPGAISFDTRKTITQHQAGVVLEQRLSDKDMLNARVYGGTRQVFQTLSFAGDGVDASGIPTSSGGVIDLDRGYGGVGLNWTHSTTANGLPLNWTLGVEADSLSERRRGFVNNGGTPGALRRNENDHARNLDVFGQIDWSFAPQWRLITGVRASRVKLSVDDQFLINGNDSGNVEYKQTSPVVGLLWSVNDTLNLYANIGKGFETPTLAEAAYGGGTGGSGPNLGLQASTSVQAELGAKIKSGRHAMDFAVFNARSKNEIVPLETLNGRSIFPMSTACKDVALKRPGMRTGTVHFHRALPIPGWMRDSRNHLAQYGPATVCRAHPNTACLPNCNIAGRTP
jgi:iron complex outermembrane receptor protein